MKYSFENAVRYHYGDFPPKDTDFLFTSPVFRNSRFVSATGIPAATGSIIIKKLIENEYLSVKEEAAGRRAALYSFEPLMRLVRV